MKWSEERIVYCTSGDSPCGSGWTETGFGVGDGTYNLKVYDNQYDDLEEETENNLFNKEMGVSVGSVCDLLIGEDDADHAELCSDHRERLDGVMNAAKEENDEALIAAVKYEIKLLDDELKEREA